MQSALSIFIGNACVLELFYSLRQTKPPAVRELFRERCIQERNLSLHNHQRERERERVSERETELLMPVSRFAGYPLGGPFRSSICCAHDRVFGSSVIHCRADSITLLANLRREYLSLSLSLSLVWRTSRIKEKKFLGNRFMKWYHNSRIS